MSTPAKINFKNKYRKLTRKEDQIIEDLQNQSEQLKKSNSQPTIHENSGSNSDESSDHSRLLVNQNLWQALTPNAKRSWA